MSNEHIIVAEFWNTSGQLRTFLVDRSPFGAALDLDELRFLSLAEKEGLRELIKFYLNEFFWEEAALLDAISND